MSLEGSAKTSDVLRGKIAIPSADAFVAARIATAAAQKTQETAENFEQNLSGTVADSCYRVIEMCKQTGMRLWIGTKAEYDALAEKPNNTIVIFTDDPSVPLPSPDADHSGQVPMVNAEGDGYILSPVAPAGHGLGRAKMIPFSEMAAVIQPGWYCLHQDMTIDGFQANYWYMRVDAYYDGGTRCTQTLYPVHTSHSYELRRIIHQGTVHPWEWADPPMVLGVEYRTTKRFKAKPVYVQRVNFGTLPAKGATVTKKVADGITNIVSWEGTITTGSGNHPKFPLFTSDGNLVAVAYMTAGFQIYVAAVTDASNYSAEFIVEYTKE